MIKPPLFSKPSPGSCLSCRGEKRVWDASPPTWWRRATGEEYLARPCPSCCPTKYKAFNDRLEVKRIQYEEGCSHAQALEKQNRLKVSK